MENLAPEPSNSGAPRSGRDCSATHVGTGGTPGEGPYVRLFLEIKNSIVHDVTYQCNGCPSSLAAAEAIARLSRGRSVEKLSLLTASELLLFMGGLPRGKEHYADLAVQCIKNLKQLDKRND